MFEDVQYTKISAYWDDLFVAGILPIFVVAFLNLQTCLKVSIISIHFNNTKELNVKEKCTFSRINIRNYKSHLDTQIVKFAKIKNVRKAL